MEECPLIAVVKQPKSNLIDVANQVSEKVDELNKILPKGVVLKPYYNQAEFVKTSIRSIIDVLWIGLALAILVVLLFYVPTRRGPYYIYHSANTGTHFYQS